MSREAMLALVALFAALTCALPSDADAARQPPLTLERTVLLMRHGVRPPTKAPPLPPGVARDPWPTWPVPPGFLTPHGADAVRIVAAYDRANLARRGLFKATGCPAAGAVSVYSDTDQRTIKTGDAYLEGFAPGCALTNAHGPQDAGDALFSPLDDSATFDEQRAAAEALGRAGPGGLTALAARNRGALNRLQRIYGCCGAPICAAAGAAAGCTFATLPNGLAAGARHKRARLTGGLDLGSTASQILLLQYADGKPMAQVGWGRASKADVQAALVLHPLEFDLLARGPYTAANLAGPLARRMLASLKDPSADAARLTALMGHDTNIAALGGLLGVHWQATDFPRDDPPPGGALALELLRDKAGHRFVRAVFRSQGMDQIRNLTPLTAAAPPYQAELAIPGCAPKAGGPCPLADFEHLVATRLALGGL